MVRLINMQEKKITFPTPLASHTLTYFGSFAKITSPNTLVYFVIFYNNLLAMRMN